MQEKIFLNGEFVKGQEAKISIFDPGFLYGQGLFETMRSYNAKIFRIDSHIQRLVSCAPQVGLKLKFDKIYLKDVLKKSLKENNLKEAYVRLSVWQGETHPNIAVFARPHDFFKKEAYKKGLSVTVSNYRQDEFSKLSGVKSFNYLRLLLAYNEAKGKNFDEALLLNSQGFIAEAARANIFLVKGNLLITPSLESGCLPGITRDTVISLAREEGIKVVEEKVKMADLDKCDEAFLTNSLIEVMPITRIEDKLIGAKPGVPGRTTEFILKHYRELINEG